MEPGLAGRHGDVAAAVIENALDVLPLGTGEARWLVVSTFGALVGRKVNKKFPGSGYYDGVVDSIDASKPATYVIVWEDGMTTKMKDTAVQKILK